MFPTIFDRINNLIRNSEASLVNLLSALAPWAAPLAPAYLSFRHMTTNLDFPLGVAWAIAFVVEALGLSAISTIIGFWSYNKRYKDETRKAPVSLAVGSFLFYLFIVIVINVALDASLIPGSLLNVAWIKIAANALLTMLSIPAAILLAIRTEHKNLLDRIEHMKAERRQQQTRPTPVESSPVADGQKRRGRAFLDDVKTGRFQQLLKEAGLTESASAIARLYSVDERTAFRWLKVKRSQEKIK